MILHFVLLLPLTNHTLKHTLGLYQFPLAQTAPNSLPCILFPPSTSQVCVLLRPLLCRTSLHHSFNDLRASCVCFGGSPLLLRLLDGVLTWSIFS